MGENLKVVYTEFLTLIKAVFVVGVINVCREKGSLLSFVYKFGQVACLLC
jgi:hypothetical protein